MRCMATHVKTITFIAEKRVSSKCGIAKFETGAFYLTCTETINDSTQILSIFLLQCASVIREKIALFGASKRTPSEC